MFHKIRKSLPKYLTLEESKRLLAAVKGPNEKRDYAILMLFLNCGIRRSELVGLNLTDVYERDVNLKIAQACYEELQLYTGVDVYMTRSNNTVELSLEKRIKYAASVNADIFVSIHNNASKNTAVNGAEVWTPNKNYNKTVYEEFGEMLFTHFGVSGPIILSASSLINRLDLKSIKLNGFLFV